MPVAGPDTVPAVTLPRATLLLVFALLLTACREDSPSTGSPGSGREPVPDVGNKAPAISGSPPQSAVIGLPYSFAPKASDADGDPLVFDISGKPEWMTFDARSGQLFGVPPASAANTMAAIVITVSDGRTVTSMPRFTVKVGATGGTGSAVLRWSAPTTTTSGAPLVDLAGFRVYYGRSQPQFDHVLDLQDPGTTEVSIEGLGAGTWYFAVSAYTRTGAESSRSSVVLKHL
jgi:hypothetical protein